MTDQELIAAIKAGSAPETMTPSAQRTFDAQLMARVKHRRRAPVFWAAVPAEAVFVWVLWPAAPTLSSESVDVELNAALYTLLDDPYDDSEAEDDAAEERLAGLFEGQDTEAL